MLKSTKYGVLIIGMGLLTFIVFLVLKLIGIIILSWWWITAPLWLPIVIAAFLAAAIAMTFTDQPTRF